MWVICLHKEQTQSAYLVLFLPVGEYTPTKMGFENIKLDTTQPQFFFSLLLNSFFFWYSRQKVAKKKDSAQKCLSRMKQENNICINIYESNTYHMCTHTHTHRADQKSMVVVVVEQVFFSRICKTWTSLGYTFRQLKKYVLNSLFYLMII